MAAQYGMVHWSAKDSKEIIMNRFTIDRTAKSADMDLNGLAHLFSSLDNFKQLTNYPYDDTVLLVYEPDRNMFFVERLGGVLVPGDQQEEVQWVRNNIDNIIAAAYNDGYGSVYTPSLRNMRDQKLYETDWMVIRHKDQQEASLNTTLSYAQYVTLLNYRQALRDITNTYTNLDDVVWPLLDI
jgi:Phage tail assembly chaperone protein